MSNKLTTARTITTAITDVIMEHLKECYPIEEWEDNHLHYERWLKMPNTLLNHETPQDLINKGEGHKVLELAHKIAQGKV